MSHSSRVAVSLLAALALGALAAPALAEEEPKNSSAEKARARRFPMDSKRFQSRLEAKLQKARASIEKALDKHKLSADRRRLIRQALGEAEKAARAAATSAAKDGSVSADEAKAVQGVWQTARARIGALFPRTRASASGVTR